MKCLKIPDLVCQDYILKKTSTYKLTQKDGARQIARTEDQGVILVYMAQAITSLNSGIDIIQYNDPYYNGLNSTTKTQLRLLLQKMDIMCGSYANKKWSIISHSWSGHLVGEVLNIMSNSSKSNMKAYYAINPAHGSFGGDNTSWENYLATTSDNVKILAGYDDVVSQNGQGVGFYKYTQAYGNLLAGSNGVYNADANRGNITQIVVNNSGHSLKDMINNGASNYIGN